MIMALNLFSAKPTLYNFHPLQLEKNDYFSGKNIWIPVIL